MAVSVLESFESAAIASARSLRTDLSESRAEYSLLNTMLQKGQTLMLNKGTKGKRETHEQTTISF